MQCQATLSQCGASYHRDMAMKSWVMGIFGSSRQTHYCCVRGQWPPTSEMRLRLVGQSIEGTCPQPLNPSVAERHLKPDLSNCKAHILNHYFVTPFWCQRINSVIHYRKNGHLYYLLNWGYITYESVLFFNMWGFLVFVSSYLICFCVTSLSWNSMDACVCGWAEEGIGWGEALFWSQRALVM